MEKYVGYIQLGTLIAQSLATVAIGYFAWATWKATQRYSKVSGLSLIEQAIHIHGGGPGAEGLYRTIIKLLAQEFPKEWAELREYAPPD
jgi:hypothetical protein